MATSPNYGWQEPDDTDLVKDGALAIRTMGDDIDSTLATALNSKLHAGLVLVKTQTIGTSVASVTVTNAFSSTYENYQIVVTGGVAASAPTYLNLRLDSQTTGYFANLIYANFTSGTPTSLGTNNGSTIPYAGYGNTDSLNCHITLDNVTLTEQTMVSFPFYDNANAGHGIGVNTNLTAHTSFTLIVNGGAISGGTIYVYGYAKD